MLALILNHATFVSRYLARGMRWLLDTCCMVLIRVAGSTENSNSRLKAARKSSIAGSLVLHASIRNLFGFKVQRGRDYADIIRHTDLDSEGHSQVKSE